MTRWIAVLVVGLAVLGSAYLFGQAWGEFLAQSQRVREARNKVAQVEAAKRTKAAQMVEVGSWNLMWEEVRASRFDPNKWVTTPVDLSRDMYWADFQELMLLVSNGNTLDAGYWFRPQTLRVVKNVARPEAARPAEGDEAVEVAPLPMPINVHISGEFLRTKGS